MKQDFNDRQKQIIECSINLIGSKGIQGLTIKNLASEVGVAESALYRHFENKNEIIYAVLSFLKNSLIKIYSDVLNQQIQPIAKIRKLMSVHFKFFNNNPSLAIVLFSDGMYKSEPELGKMILSIMQFVKNSYIMVIDDGKRQKQFRTDISSENLAFIVMGSIRLTINQWNLAGYNYKLTAKGDDLWKSIKKIIAI